MAGWRASPITREMGPVMMTLTETVRTTPTTSFRVTPATLETSDGDGADAGDDDGARGGDGADDADAETEARAPRARPLTETEARRPSPPPQTPHRPSRIWPPSSARWQRGQVGRHALPSARRRTAAPRPTPACPTSSTPTTYSRSAVNEIQDLKRPGQQAARHYRPGAAIRPESASEHRRRPSSGSRPRHPDLDDNDIESIRNHTSAQVNVAGIMANFPGDPVDGLTRALEIGSMTDPPHGIRCSASPSDNREQAGRHSTESTQCPVGRWRWRSAPPAAEGRKAEDVE